MKGIIFLPFLIFLGIGLLVVGSSYYTAKYFTPNSEVLAPLNPINQTYNITGDITKDVTDQMSVIPFYAIYDMLVSGTSDVAMWIANFFSMLISYPMRAIFYAIGDPQPEFIVPWFVGMGIFLIVMAGFIFKAVTQIWMIGHDASTWIIIVVVLIVVIWAFLTFMGVI